MRTTHAAAAAVLAALALALALAGAAPCPRAGDSPAAPPAKGGAKPNLIVNGSFEDGPEFEGPFLPLDEDAVDLRGWAVTRGQIDLLQATDNGYPAAHGKRSLDLHGSPGFGGVRQPLVTKVGQKYAVTFRMSGNAGIPLDSVQLAVRAAGKKEVFACDMAGKTVGDPKWEQKTWEFTATDTITVLEFRTAMPPPANPFGGPMLDDVKVVAAD
jgi:choice-of-anchor C domain-containing protein